MTDRLIILPDECPREGCPSQNFRVAYMLHGRGYRVKCTRCKASVKHDVPFGM